ncbi:Zinc-regulated transporter [Wickerhamomyces ciferrii]|uniref:Zinc-regulated transporter n=1 Tax=Wickerhamomyces ciferrii (strain ATCC 14091 / BCRC 22168 / CBS 111 / JCM 3599 / NBRC 0793 / NRRL Y-1031 F-60-10) TaxID=1206466 RepID=K0KER2_WICCF|nr:Zinc-regulated transporter [Wickerhamomyces ciferrii]CCH41421.1 Zinc-regulated transporter [Wickerhamomyces ciferrii]
MSDECSTQNDYDGRNGLRILSIFIMLISSGLGTFFPLLSSRYSSVNLPNWCWFFAKFFGSGVIVATGFIHLLQPASEALTDECLTGVISEYPWAFGICLMSLFLLFLTEIIAHHYIDIAAGNHKHGDQTHSHNHGHGHGHGNSDPTPGSSRDEFSDENENYEMEHFIQDSNSKVDETIKSIRLDNDDIESNYSSNDTTNSNYLNQILSVFILEFGVIFHSIFVGLSLSVSGEEFITLFIVLTFHQMFEGLGLGTRIAEVKWDKSRRSTPWYLALGFTFATPIAIAVGLGVRKSFNPGSRTALITNGVFDSISAGILIYTGIVELMAHEFLFSNQFKGEGGLQKMLCAYGVMCIGAGLMSLLGKWV